MPRQYALTTYDGKRVDWLTRGALEDCAAELGYDLTIVQGSYRALDGGGAPASAGTHDRGGVVDLAPYDHARKVLVLRKHGFAAWFRPAIPGVWNDHVHAVQVGNRNLSPAAAAQVLDYLNGRNGLAGHGADDGPRQYVNVRYRWARGGVRIRRARALLEQASLLLSTGIRGYAVAKSRRALREATANLPK